LSNRKIIIGSRGSDLALWQAHFVEGQLQKLGHEVEINIIKTQGDKIQHLSFDKMEGKGFFTKEIEESLLQETIDLAIHSHKDLETTNPEGLAVAAVSYRENPSELILIRKEAVDASQPFKFKKGAVVGTSSARRKVQLLHQRNDIALKDIRGNVPTRIQKLRDGQFDAIMLAYAGVKRLEIDLSEFEAVVLDPKDFIPAPAQGVLGLQIRESDTELAEILQQLNHPEVQQTTVLEREVLRLFQGGCQLPLGSYAEKQGEEFHLWAAMADTWDAPLREVKLTGTDPKALATEAVEALKKK
tara:strand:- start:605 stop:1504 length:900 start_codon:yes stop_codon:yes gene_type:complete